MPSIIGIDEVVNPLISFMPIILITISGYTIGNIVCKVRKVHSNFTKDLVYGNVALNFIFILGFIIFGVLTFTVNEYFTVFMYIIVGLTILGAYFLAKKLLLYVTNRDMFNSHLNKSGKVTARNKNLLFIVDTNKNIFIIFGIALIATILAFHAVIIYYHTIYSEYDSLYLFLPISKSILLGNGLNHDFYFGSDVNMRFPPFVQAVNAWLLHSFEHSSIRMFPIYYVFFATLLVYSFARNVLIKTSNKGDASFFALISSSAFLITPAILVISSRFSLQQDIPFIFFLTASFYFLSEIMRYDKPAKVNLLMLSSSLALMILTREIGLLIAIAIFFILPAIKYTEGNLKLRFLFTVLSLLPFYFYYLFFYSSDPINSGLIIVILSNLAIFYIATKIKNQNKFSSLVKPVNNFKYITPLFVPVIFIATNLIIFNGVYPDITFSDKFYEIINLQLDIFANQNDDHVEFIDRIEGFPRLDILFLATAIGGIFIILKLVGLGKIVYQLKSNFQYSLIIILMIFLLIAWASLLQSGFKTSNIRHVAYFVPLLTLLLVVGMKTDRESSAYWKIFCYSVIVFATYYFLSYSLHPLVNNSKFEGFTIDPFRNPIMTSTDLAFGIILALPLLLIAIKKVKRFQNRKENFKALKFPFAVIVAALSILLAFQTYALTFSEIAIIIPQMQDHLPSPGWENNVFEVVNYLSASEKGNVLAVRAPAIPFFTNRTSFDLYYPQSFAYSIYDIISNNNSTSFKQSLTENGIRYIVIPNEKSSLFYMVENLMKKTRFVQSISADNDFQKIELGNFNIYKYSPISASKIDLIDKNHVWNSFGKTQVEQSRDNLTLRVDTSERGREYNRAYLQTKLDLENKPFLLSFRYDAETSVGNATYLLEIRDNTSRIVFDKKIGELSSSSTHHTFMLPNNIVGGIPYEFRIYVITEGISYHSLIVKELSVSYA